MRIVVSVGTALAGLLLISAPPPVAQADNDSFASQAKSLGFVQSSPNLVSTARSACYFLWLNRDPGQVSERISRYLSVDPDMANRFFAMSVREYCPQFGGLVHD